MVDGGQNLELGDAQFDGAHLSLDIFGQDWPAGCWAFDLDFTVVGHVGGDDDVMWLTVDRLSAIKCSSKIWCGRTPAPRPTFRQSWPSNFDLTQKLREQTLNFLPLIVL
jgi:hypothetical protein